MMAITGALAFGLVIGWSGAFTGGTWASIAYRIAAASAAGAACWMLHPAGLAASLAGVGAGSIGHDLFTMGLRRAI